MKHKLSTAVALIIFTIIALLIGKVEAQTVGPGPYYANPSWDQTIACTTISNCPRFIVLSNMSSNAVLDRETGLVWEKSPDTFTRDWVNANIRCLTKAVGNRKGWRLPTVQELGTLVDPTILTGPTLPAGHPFANIQSAIYWSASTTAGNGPLLAWFVSFDDGHIANIPKEDAHNFWCVRGGQGIDPQ